MNEEWVGWKGEILIDEKGKDDSWIGRNFAYKQVIIKGNYALGQTVTVIVKRAGTYDLRAEEISKR
jgi:tRNA A37 methylthiotransferase MiaB